MDFNKIPINTLSPILFFPRQHVANNGIINLSVISATMTAHARPVGDRPDPNSDDKISRDEAGEEEKVFSPSSALSMHIAVSLIYRWGNSTKTLLPCEPNDSVVQA